MATPSGPCLSPWRNSFSQRFYRLKKRKPIEPQTLHNSAKRRCFTHSAPSCVPSTSSSPSKSCEEPRLSCQPLTCGHDSLLHGYEEGEAPFALHQHMSRTRVSTEDEKMDADEDVTVDAGVAQSSGTLRTRVEELTDTLQFMKEHEISSNDYWAIPQDSELSMMAEIEQARIAMESDYVPNPDQYRPAAAKSTLNESVRIFCKHSSDVMWDQAHFF